MYAKSGAVSSSPRLAPTTSMLRLSSLADGVSRSGGSPISGRPSTVCTSTRGPTRSKRRGTMSICRSSSRHDRTIARMSSSDSFENDTMTRSTSRSRTISGSCAGVPRRVRCSRSTRGFAGLGVDEADEIEAVLRVLEQLARHQLADVARADDDGVLEVEDAPPADRPGGAAADRDEDERRDAEERELAQLRIREAERPERQRDQPHAGRDQVQDADDLVDRRMVGALLVSLVEPVQLRQDDPERQAGQEHQQLLRVRRAVEDAAGVEGRDQEERQRQAGDVGEEQHAPDEPAAPLVRQLGAALLEDGACASVHRVEETPLERRRESRVAMRFRRPSLCRHQLPPIEHVLPHETAIPQGPRLLFEPIRRLWAHPGQTGKPRPPTGH